jgi:protein phosphatase
MNNVNTEPESAVLPIRVGAVSEKGNREENQDSMSGFSSAFGAVYMIADGMGGHRGGAEASRMVVEGFNRHLLATPATSPARDAVTLAMRLTNVEILEKGKSGSPEFQGMGSTVVIALVRRSENGLELTTAHVGDSRIYLHRDGVLTQLTKDHTQVQWLLDTHAIDEAAARNHPDASVLTRALGHNTDLQVDISEAIPLADGDAILLCSDGLSGFASSEDINQTVEQNPDPVVCAQELVHLALDSGSNDNITVQFLRIGDAVSAPQVPAPPPASAPPKHHTQMEMAAMPRPAASETAGRPPIKPRSRLPLIAILVVVLALAGGLYWWMRSRHGGVNEDATKLGPRIDKLGADAKDCKERALQDKKAVDDEDLKNLEKQVKKSKDSPESKDLRKNLQKLSDDFKAIALRAERMEKQTERAQAAENPTYRDELAAIQAEQDAKKRNGEIRALKSELDSSEDELKEHIKTDLDGEEKNKKPALEKQLDAYLKAPKHGNDSNVPTQPAGPGDQAQH